jgi:hypothetical protein
MRWYSDMRVGLAGAQMPRWPAATRRANRPPVGRLVREVQDIVGRSPFRVDQVVDRFWRLAITSRRVDRLPVEAFQRSVRFVALSADSPCAE